jgi:hypothetical protein
MLSLAQTHAPTRTRTHARMYTSRHVRAHTRALAQSNASAHALSLDALTHSTRCYGGVRDSVRMRRCSRRQRCRQILRARWPRRALLCAQQARQRSCESRRHVNSARAVALGTQCVDAECRSTSRRSMDNDPAACDTGNEMTAECALPCPCASPVPARARRAPSRVRLRA